MNSVFAPKLKYTSSESTVQEFSSNLSEQGGFAKINPNPIGQRPPVQKGFNKSREIIETMLRGISCGTITLRDISEDEASQVFYPGQKYHIIDGGHRGRAIRDFVKGKFDIKLGGQSFYFQQLDDNVQEYFLGIKINLIAYVCSNQEAQMIFKAVNTVTPVNDMESIMYNDTSMVAKHIRSRTSYYHEYQNEVHPLFETKMYRGDIKPVHWESDVNPRRLWDEFVAICFAKVIGRGNAEAGYSVIEEMVNTDLPISSADCKKVDKILNDVLKIKRASGNKFNKDKFAAAQAVLFELLDLSPEFVITDHNAFGKEFLRAHSNLTGNSSSRYDDVFEIYIKGFDKKRNKKVYDTEKTNAKKFARRAIKNFANPWQQRKVAAMYLEEMKDVIKDHVILRDKSRSITRKEREELLAQQGFVCAIDGLDLSLDESVFGHDISWSEADIRDGKTLKGQVVRATHNSAMGTITLDEYRSVLAARQAAP